MTDPDNSRSSDFKRRRISGFEPVDTRLWELPDEDATPRGKNSTATSTRWLAYWIIAIVLIVGLLFVLVL